MKYRKGYFSTKLRIITPLEELIFYIFYCFIFNFCTFRKISPFKFDKFDSAFLYLPSLRSPSQGLNLFIFVIKTIDTQIFKVYIDHYIDYVPVTLVPGLYTRCSATGVE